MAPKMLFKSRPRFGLKTLLRSVAGILLLISMLLLTTGCWDEVDLTDQGYVSAMGVDYEDDQYTMYVQLIQLSSVAKSKENSSSSQSSVWVGSGKGKTMLMALGNLQNSSQFMVNLDHMKVLVVQDRALKHMDDILDANNRQRASRYTCLVFATKAPFEKLFNTDTFFGRSPLLSIMYNPQIQFKQNSLIRPVTMQELVKALDEPGFTAVLPVIGINQGNWQESDQKLAVQQYEGVIPFYRTEKKAFMSTEEISGMRWIDPTFVQHYIYTGLKKGGDGQDESIATVNMTSSKPTYRLIQSEPTIKIKLDVHTQGHLIELTGPMTEKEISREVVQKVKADIEKTYMIGCSKKVDILQLEELLYRKHNKLWKKLHARAGEWNPKVDDLEVEVHFDLVHTGKFDLS